jgi:hypothetical protein
MTNAVSFDLEPARAFLDAYAERTQTSADPFWLVMDAVGFLPPPGRKPIFSDPEQLSRLDAWLHGLMTSSW